MGVKTSTIEFFVSVKMPFLLGFGRIYKKKIIGGETKM